MASPRYRGHAGVLLIMVLLGVGLALLLTFGGGGVTGTAEVARDARDSAEGTVNELVVAQLVQAITAHELVHGGPPSGVEELAGVGSGAFEDPWGGALTFAFDGSGRSRVVVVRSSGPDGVGGTADDVEVRRPMPI